MPEWVVLLNSPPPGLVTSRCTGIALNKRLILTVQHCIDDRPVKRIMTQSGQEINRIEVLFQSSEFDLALIETGLDLDINSFPEIGEADHTKPAIAFGACPFYMLNTTRRLDFIQMYEVSYEGKKFQSEMWRVATKYICPGDSGGPVIQSGKLVGIIHATRKKIPENHKHGIAFVIPSNVIQNLTEQYIESNRP